MLRSIYFILVTLSLALSSANSYASAQIDQFPGSIPLDNSRGIATDLVLQDGTLLNPSQAEEIRKEYARKYKAGDLSLLEPKSSTLWDPEDENPINLRPLKINLKQSVQYKDASPSWLKSLMFLVEQEKRTYLVFASKKAHNLLLRKALLEKLGYRVPDMKWVPSLKIAFNTPSEKNQLLARFGQGDELNPGQFVGDSNLWVVKNKKGSVELELRDLIIMNSSEPIYNLAMGNFDTQDDTIKGRRTFNSLILPFALVDSPESINLFSPKFGKEFSGYAILDYQFPEKFYPTYEDARWIARKILKLSRSDFSEIAAATKYPKEEILLLTELLIARRNDLTSLFNLNYKQKPVKLNQTYGTRLIDGKLIPTFKDTDDDLPEALPIKGYAVRTAYGDQKSPLTKAEVFSFFKGIGQSNIITNVINEFNNRFLPSTNVGKQVAEHQIQLAAEQWVHYIRTGEVKKIEFGAYSIPHLGFDIIANRNIVIGNYMGSEQNVQLADTVGFSVDAGLFIGFDGIKAPTLLTGGANAYYNRQYTHLKPIVSIQESLKTPFKNMIVPWFKKNLASVFKDIETGNLSELRTEEGFQRVKEMLDAFKDQFQDGESLLITDSLGGGLSLNASYPLNSIIRAQVNFANTQTVLWRTNIVRKGDQMHIYKDLGRMGTIMIKLGLNLSRIPIVSVAFNNSKGKARTYFNYIDLAPDEENKNQTIANIIALKNLLLNNSVKEANLINKPYKITHKFAESSCSSQFLIWHQKCQRSNDYMIINYPEGHKRRFYRSVGGNRTGRNYQQLFVDVINSLMDEFLNTTYSFNNVTSGNPGDTFLGKSTTDQVIFETELKPNNAMTDMFVSFSMIKKGWELKQKNAIKEIKAINKELGYVFFPPDVLYRTKALQLYNINFQLNFYENALKRFMGISQSDHGKVFRKYCRMNQLKKVLLPNSSQNNSGRDSNFSSFEASKAINSLVLKMKEHYLKKEIFHFSKSIRKYIEAIATSCKMQGIMALAGDKKNYFARAQIGGFRKGDEDGDVPYLTDTLGKMGSAAFNGPLQGLKNEINIVESELFIRWLLGSL